MRITPYGIRKAGTDRFITEKKPDSGLTRAIMVAAPQEIA